MSLEKNFEIVKFEDLKVIRYRGAISDSVKVDLFLTLDMYDKYEGTYAQIVPRFRPKYPNAEEFANESLEYILDLAWQDGLPENVKNLMSNGKVAVFDAHGTHYDDIGWGVHIQDEGRIPITRLLDEHFSEYDTVLLTVCNPNRQQLEPQKGSVIYPLGFFGIEPNDFEMVVRKDPNI